MANGLSAPFLFPHPEDCGHGRFHFFMSQLIGFNRIAKPTRRDDVPRNVAPRIHHSVKAVVAKACDRFFTLGVAVAVGAGLLYQYTEFFRRQAEENVVPLSAVTVTRVDPVPGGNEWRRAGILPPSQVALFDDFDMLALNPAEPRLFDPATEPNSCRL